MNFNRNFHHNSRYNADEIRKIVKQMMDDGINRAPFDFLFRYNSRNYPKTCHNVFDLPGKFKRTEDTAVFVTGNGVLQMDYAESVIPDGKFVKRDVAVDVEHQTGPLDNDKIETIFNYCLYTSIKLKKPCYSIVITNYDYIEDFKTYYVEGFPLNVYFRVFNKKRLYEILNTLKSKDYNQEYMSNGDYINFINCLIFSKKPYAKDMIKKLTYFASIEKVTYSHQLDLHLALKMLIKYHFQGDDDKIEELLTVITKAVHESKREELVTYESKQFSVDELEEKNSQLISENSQLVSELSKKDSELSKKDEEIKKLKQIISLHNIVV